MTGPAVVPLTFSLGPVVFGGPNNDDFEIPDSKGFGPLGGEQQVAVHRFPGGTKTVQSLGAFPGPITFKGILTGINAFSRFQLIDRMRVTGQIQTLVFGPWRWNGIVTQFTGEPDNAYWIPYELIFEPISDASGQTAQAAAQPTIDAALTQSTQNLATRVADPTNPLAGVTTPNVIPQLQTVTSSFTSALSGAGGSIAQLTPGTVTTLLGNVTTAQRSLAVIANGGPVANGQGGGTLEPGGSIFYTVSPIIKGIEQSTSPETAVLLAAGQTAVSLAWNPVAGAQGYNVYRGFFTGNQNEYFSTATPSFTDLGFAGVTRRPITSLPLTMLTSSSAASEALATSALLTVMSNQLQPQNVAWPNASKYLAILTAINPNLYQLAAYYYGDATQWPKIAAANAIFDPLPTGQFQGLLVPVIT